MYEDHLEPSASLLGPREIRARLFQALLILSTVALLCTTGCPQSKKQSLTKRSPPCLRGQGCSERPNRPLVTKEAEPHRPDSSLHHSQVGPAITKFGEGLMARAQVRAKENFLVSPMSVFRSLLLARTGAAGRTAREMNRFLGLPADAGAKEVTRAVGRVTASAINDAHNIWTDSPDGESFAGANRVFVSDAFSIDPKIDEINLKTLSDEVVNKDFKKHPERTRKEINAWVAENTRSRIPKLLPPGLISSSTRLLLVNATWFRGDWEHPFDKKRTRARPFFVNGKQSKRVPMMHLVSNFRTLDSDAQAYRAIELPYLRGRVSMIVVLPKKGQDLGPLESKLVFSKLAELISKQAPRKVELRLPRFRVESSKSVSLFEVLKTMGLKVAFDDRQSDFSAMTTALAPLAIDDVIHKSVLIVNEYGELSTQPRGVKKRAGRSPIVMPFHVNRPFLFFVHHNKSGTLLFAGRIIDPLGTPGKSR